MTRTRNKFRALYCGVLTLIVGFSLTGNYAMAAEAGSAPGCKSASFSPEVTSYYGDSAAVIDKMENANVKVDTGELT